MLKDCYAVLTAMVRRNASCAALLRQHINHFLSQSGLGLHASDLVVQLVRGNARACACVAEHHILRAIYRLSDRSAYRRLRRLRFLRAVVALPGACVVPRRAGLAVRCHPRCLVLPLTHTRVLPVCLPSWASDGGLVPRNQMLLVRGVCERRSALGLLGRLHSTQAAATLIELADSDVSLGVGIGHEEAGTGGGLERSPSEAMYYVSLLQLLALCAPNKLVYRNGMAMREGEEAALLCQAAVPLPGLMQVLQGTNSAVLKSAILRFVEQVYGAHVLASMPSAVVNTAQHAMPATGPTQPSPIQAILLDVAVCVDRYAGAIGLDAYRPVERRGM